jgi:carbon-monoxide dehydrogenase medium subunit
MYPSRFAYEAPTNIDDAIKLLQEGGGEAKVLAGGQSLVPMMKLRFASPDMLVDINGLPDLDHLQVGEDGSVRIGALCRHADLERAAVLAATQPTMAAVAPLVADPLVRTRGTLVGSLCHADPQGDWASVVTALDGQVVAQGPDGQRTIAIKDFVSGPFQTTLAPDEIAIEAIIPAPVGTASGGYLKLERRVGDFATVGVAVALQTSGSAIVKAGIGLTGVGGSTIDAADAAESLVDSELSDAGIERAADLAAEAARPNSDHRGSAEYKRHVVHTFVTRLLRGVAQSEERAA